jgi:hypothetical protein
MNLIFGVIESKLRPNAIALHNGSVILKISDRFYIDKYFEQKPKLVCNICCESLGKSHKKCAPVWVRVEIWFLLLSVAMDMIVLILYFTPNPSQFSCRPHTTQSNGFWFAFDWALTFDWAFAFTILFTQ